MEGNVMDVEVSYSLILDTLRYCMNHCDSTEEHAVVVWVTEKIQDAVRDTFARQIVERSAS